MEKPSVWRAIMHLMFLKEMKMPLSKNINNYISVKVKTHLSLLSFDLILWPLKKTQNKTKHPRTHTKIPPKPQPKIKELNGNCVCSCVKSIPRVIQEISVTTLNISLMLSNAESRTGKRLPLVTSYHPFPPSNKNRSSR